VLPSDTPERLEAIPKAEQGPAPSAPVRRLPSGSANGSKTNSSYERPRPDPRSNRSRSDNLAHALISTPVPAARSAQESVSGASPSSNADADSVLDHLPPLDLPKDVTEKSPTPPVAPAAERKPSSAAPASDHLSGRSYRESDLTLASTVAPAP